jgi:hypothetical protein
LALHTLDEDEEGYLIAIRLSGGRFRIGIAGSGRT